LNLRDGGGGFSRLKPPYIKAFTLAEVFSPHFKDNRKIAFTLAEVLITLGIIGVVAAMTLPTLIGNYQKHVVETKLKRFYSMANQAIQLAEVELGPKTEWNFRTEACNADSYGEQCLTEFFDKYLKKNLKYTKTEYNPTKRKLFIYLADGSLISLEWQGQDIKYYINSKKAIDGTAVMCKDVFFFGLYPNYEWPYYKLLYKHYYGRGVEPYLRENWDGNMDTIYNNTEHCAFAIQHNGWKIPDDYPLKF